MTDALHELLASKGVLLADGAMGTSLFARGLATGDSPELWNLDHPERVRAVHRGFVEAGSDLILTNSFGANRCRLALHGAAGRVAELNRAAAGLARAEADRAGRTVLVAGSIGPTGEIFQPIGALAQADGAAAFAEQADGARRGRRGPALDRDHLGRRGARGRGRGRGADRPADRRHDDLRHPRPHDDGPHARGRDGVARRSRDPPRRPSAPIAASARRSLVESVLGLARAAAPGDLIVAKGNCGIPQYQDGHIHYDGTPAVMADYACLARDAGARIIGGCCGTTPAHLAAMAEALASRPAGPPPERATIEARLGPLPTPPEPGEAGAASAGAGATPDGRPRMPEMTAAPRILALAGSTRGASFNKRSAAGRTRTSRRRSRRSAPGSRTWCVAWLADRSAVAEPPFVLDHGQTPHDML